MNFLDAIKNNDTELVQSLINKVVVNRKDEDDFTPLQLAIKSNNLEMVEILLKNGANIKGKDDFFKRTVLHDEAFNGNTEIVELLLKYGADVDAKDKDKLTPLLVACSNIKPNLKTIKLLFNKSFPSIRLKKDVLTEVLSTVVTLDCDLEFIQLLIDNGADITIEKEDYTRRDYLGEYLLCTLLDLSIKNKQKKIATFLIEKGIKANYSGGFFDTFSDGKYQDIYGAIDNNDIELIKLYFSLGLKVYPEEKKLIHAIENKNNDICRLFLNNFSLNKINTHEISNHLSWNPDEEIMKLFLSSTLFDISKNEFYTRNNSYYENDIQELFFIAIREGFKNIVNMLINRVNLDYKNRSGHTSLQSAYFFGQSEIFKIIEEYTHTYLGDDLNLQLYLAILDNNLEKTKELIGKKVDLNKEAYKNFEKPLFIAIKNKNKDMVQLLLNNGSDANSINEDGEVPLFEAAKMKGNIDIVKLLIENGADINYKHKQYRNGKWFYSVLYYAIFGDIDTFKYLYELIEEKNEIVENITLLESAINVSNKEIIKFLIDNGAKFDKESNIANDLCKLGLI